MRRLWKVFGGHTTEPPPVYQAGLTPIVRVPPPSPTYPDHLPTQDHAYAPPFPYNASTDGHKHLSDSALARQLAAEEAEQQYSSPGHAQGSVTGHKHLTDSALARQLAAEEDDSTFARQLLQSDVATPSFSVTLNCPYERCYNGRNVPLESFVGHVMSQHASETNQKYACPVCSLSTGETYSVHDNTNLVAHLRAVHSTDAVTTTPVASAPTGTGGPTVHCPYIGCSSSTVPKRSFTTHVATFHQSAASHKYACPLCYITTGQTYAVHDGTNLLTHLQSTHNNEENVDELSYEELLELEEKIGSVSIAPSSNIIDQLPTHTFSKSKVQSKNDQELDEELYTICLTEYEDGEVLKTLPCVHFYHKSCIDEWLNKHKVCPVCKFDITTNPDTF